MPELPEVETVCRGLEAVVAGAVIHKVELKRHDLRSAFSVGFAKSIEGARIKKISRRAKYLVFTLDNGRTLLAHLGMSGRFSVEAKPPKHYAKHDHVIFTLADGRVMIYNDARRFGRMEVVETSGLEEHKLLAHLGPEPFSKKFSANYLKDALIRRKGPVKPVLMHQELVVGVGNIYASEVLFLAKIHPQAPAYKAADKAALLIKCIRKVLEDAIQSGGSSLRDFVKVSGEAGYFQHHFNVYGRAKKPCFRCKTPIQSIVQAGRTTFFCPKCQK